MAKKSSNKNLNSQSQSSTRWENTLPSSYETLVNGFNADMTVDEMLQYLRIDRMMNDLALAPIEVPEEIRKVKIGAFTPNMFEHERFKEFWDTPVTSYHLYSDKALFRALNDPDIKQIQRENAGYNIDTVRPTLGTLARVAQMQYLGFNLRMSELTSSSMMTRLNKLKEPREYAKMREVAKRYKVELPKDAPEFSLVHQETCVKQIGSALEKAYYRTGKPADVDAFLANPDAFGVNGVNDMKRTMIKIPEDRKNQLENYKNVRNLFAVASLSGELGFICSEITDNVLYPVSPRPSDLNPVLMIKGEMYHAGPVFSGKGSIINSRVEAQVVLMPDHGVKSTHDMYKMSRHKDATPEMRVAMDDARVKIFDSYLSEELREKRNDFLKTGKVVNDPLGHILFVASNGFNMTRHAGMVRKNAIMCACDEFPNEVSIEKMHENITDITLNNTHDLLVQKTLRALIQADSDDVQVKREERSVARRMQPVVS